MTGRNPDPPGFGRTPIARVRRRLTALFTLLAVAGIAPAGCGSGDGDGDTKAAEDAAATRNAGAAENSGATGEARPGHEGSTGKGEIRPDRRAPESAGDRKPNLPDKVIADRPGGHPKPARP